MKQTQPKPATDLKARERRLRTIEGSATFGLILVCVALVAPFASIENATVLRVFKWIYAAGVLIFLAARIAGSVDKSESVRLRRLRRMEAWAGFAFAIGAFFWFYNAGRHGEDMWTLGLLQNTILFTLVGSLIQIIASWLIYSLNKKEASGSGK